MKNKTVENQDSQIIFKGLFDKSKYHRKLSPTGTSPEKGDVNTDHIFLGIFIPYKLPSSNYEQMSCL